MVYLRSVQTYVIVVNYQLVSFAFSYMTDQIIVGPRLGWKHSEFVYNPNF